MRYGLAFIFMFFFGNLFGQIGSGTTETVEKIVAVVGDDIILKSEIDARAQFFVYQNGGDAGNEDLWKKMLEATIDEKIVLAKAMRDSVEVNDALIELEAKQRLEYLVSKLGSEKSVEDYFGKPVAAIISDITSQVKNQQLLSTVQQKIVSKISVSNKEVEHFYESFKDSLPELPAQVEISRILIFPSVDSLSKASAYNKIALIQQKLKSGSDFGDLAKEYSEDVGSAKEGGDMGFIKRGEFVKNFEAEVFKLREEEVSDIVETEFGFHIIKLLERRGEKVRAQHILIKFDKTKLDEESAIRKLNKIRESILKNEISFGYAARVFSQDEASAKVGGDIIEPSTRTNRLNFDDLASDMKTTLESLKAGEISQPSKVYFAPKEKDAFQLLFLKEKIKPHKMNLQQDYTMIQNFALQQLQQKHLKIWLNKLRTEIYWAFKN